MCHCVSVEATASQYSPDALFPCNWYRILHLRVDLQGADFLCDEEVVWQLCRTLATRLMECRPSAALPSQIGTSTTALGRKIAIKGQTTELRQLLLASCPGEPSAGGSSLHTMQVQCSSAYDTVAVRHLPSPAASVSYSGLTLHLFFQNSF